MSQLAAVNTQSSVGMFQFYIVLGACFLLGYRTLFYGGRSINKLQNGAIPLTFKTGKIGSIRFELEFNFEDA